MTLHTHHRPYELTDSQYRSVTALFNECNHDFWLISETTRNAFFDRLYGTGEEFYKVKMQTTKSVRED
jgi:hypothetical protein